MVYGDYKTMLIIQCKQCGAVIECTRTTQSNTGARTSAVRTRYGMSNYDVYSAQVTVERM